MDLPKRKYYLKPILEYIKSGDITKENLLGMRASLQAMITAIDRRLKELTMQRDRLKRRLKLEEDESWLD